MSASTDISRKRKRELQDDVVHGVAPRTDSSTTSGVDGDSLSGGDHLATAATPDATAAPPAVTAATPDATAATPCIKRVSELPLSGQLFCAFRLSESRAKNNRRRFASAAAAARAARDARAAAKAYSAYLRQCEIEGIQPHPLSPDYNPDWN
mgnify:CR=1 FL=1